MSLDTLQEGIADLDPVAFRERLRAWIAEHLDELRLIVPDETLPVEETYARPRSFHSTLFDAGWLRVGWSPDMGGLGGSVLLRAQVYDELAAVGILPPEALTAIEVLGPALARFAPELAAVHLRSLLRGDEMWVQCFSETEAGSDLASLSAKAAQNPDGSWLITGHKIWNSFGVVADRAVVLARTGSVLDRHRGISMFLVDVDQPGVEIRPIKVMTGRNELSEVRFDGAVASADRLIGEINGGWAVAMYLLQWERGPYAWTRQAWVHERLDRLAKHPEVDDRELGAAYLRALALRLVSRGTLRLLAIGQNPGAKISVDKLLLSSSEQQTLDLARAAFAGDFALGDDHEIRHWTNDYFFTRTASIYGGAAEIQRDTIARRVMGLPRE